MKFITQGINTAGILGIVFVLLSILLVVVFFNREEVMSVVPIWSDTGRVALPPATTTDPDAEPEETEPAPASGVYQTYTPDRLAAVPPEAQTVLFFTSGRCNSCQEVEADILANEAAIPENVYILHVDYDSSLSLRRQYSVVTPHTFVEVDSLGRLVQRWRGSMSLNSILARI